MQVMRRERGELAAHGVAAASADRLREVLGGYLAYAGRYEVDPAARTVTHRIECGLVPAPVGTELTRWNEIDGASPQPGTTPESEGCAMHEEA